MFPFTHLRLTAYSLRLTTGSYRSQRNCYIYPPWLLSNVRKTMLHIDANKVISNKYKPKHKTSSSTLNYVLFIWYTQHTVHTTSMRPVKVWGLWSQQPGVKLQPFIKLCVSQKSLTDSVLPFTVQRSMAFIKLMTSDMENEEGARPRWDASWMPTQVLNLTGTADTVHRPFLQSTHFNHEHGAEY